MPSTLDALEHQQSIKTGTNEEIDGGRSANNWQKIVDDDGISIGL